MGRKTLTTKPGTCGRFKPGITAADELALAAAGIDNQTNAQRQFRLAGEELNLLSNTVFKDLEIIAAKPRDKLPQRIARYRSR